MHRHLKRTSTLLVFFVLVVITPCKASLTRISNNQQHLFVLPGGAADFDCILSDPKAKVELYHKKRHMATDGVKVAEVGQIFTVYNITSANAGDYRCKASLGNGLRKSFSLGQITVFSFHNSRLKFSVSPKINTALEGESASFTCRATSSKHASVSWHKSAKKLTNQKKSKNGNEYTSVLTLTDLDKSDSGIYQCRVKVEMYSQITLDKMGYFPTQAELIVKPFEFTSRHQTVFVGVVGSSLTIYCNNTDTNASTSLWVQLSHNSFQQVRPDGVRVIQDGPKFIIHRVTIQDGGRYTCKAVSTYGRTISMDMGKFIVLQGGYRDPKAYISPRIKNLNLDKSFNFTCQAFGDSINFTWFKDGSTVPQDMIAVLPRRHYKGYTMFESILTIRNAEKSDEGRYTCQITSALQPGYSHSITANLTIYECPKANGTFRDPFNNTLYIECVNGIGTRIECPFPGQYWEDSTKNCVFPPTTPTTPVLTWISDERVTSFVPIEGSFVFDCSLTDPSIPVQLQKDRKRVQVDGKKVKLVGQKFTISKLKSADSAEYTCHANGVGNPKRIRVTVNKDLTLDLSVHVPGGTYRFELETSFNKSIRCESYNHGRVYWYKVDPISNKLTLKTIGPNAIRDRTTDYFITWAYLNLSNVRPEDAGTYMCYKNNSVGAVANTTVEVLVKAPVKPKLSTSSSLKTIKEKQPLKFNVVVLGSPFPDVTWYNGQLKLVSCRGGQSLNCQNKINYKISGLNILKRGPRPVLHFTIMKPLHPADNGEHRIKVQNLAGEDQAKFNVSVIVPPIIRKKNNDVVTKVISKNSPFTLVCNVPRAVPSPVFTWEYQVLSCSGSKNCKPNPTRLRPIPESVAKVRNDTSRMRSFLEVRPILVSIHFRCEVKNDAGDDKKDFVLHRRNNLDKELTIEGEKMKYKDEHENITMTCRALKSFVGHPTWRDSDDRVITNTSRIRITFRESSTEYLTHLQIFDAQVNDSGVYACEATNEKKKDNTSTSLRVFALKPPFVTIANLTANEMNHVSFNCTVSGNPSPIVSWFKAGKLLETKDLSSLSECSSRLNDFYLHVYPSEMGKPRTHSLVICNARYHNTGWYTCKARNIIDVNVGKAYLNVQAPPTVELINEELQESVKSGRFVIRCHATGNPTPHVRWLKQSENGSFVTSGNISSWKLGNNTLFLSELKTELRGTYRCIAANALGQTYTDRHITLKPPFVTIANLTANETNHMSLNCTVSGYPSPIVSWFKEGKLLETKDLSSLSECSSRLNDFYLHVYPSEMGKPRTHSLVICNARYHNTGWYTCKARNIIDVNVGKAYLNVQAPPTVELIYEELQESVKSGRLVVIRCHATGNPTPHVRWLKQSEDGSFVTSGNITSWKLGNNTLILSESKAELRGTYRCIAANALGQRYKDRHIKSPVVRRVRSPDPGAVSKPALIAIVVSGSLVILLLLVIIAVLYRRKKLYGGFYILTLPPMPDYIKKLDPSRTLQEQTHKLPLSADWEFPRNRLNLGKVIGSGAFGQVFLADAVGIVAFDPRSSMRGRGSRRRSRFGSTKSPYYNNKQVTVVACKGLKEDATESEFRDLVSELKILMHIGEHKNIVNLLGACTKGRECDLLVIIEYCPHGNLLEFLRKRRDLFQAEWAPATEKADERFSTTDLVITAFQVARAMEFLASRRCVHRDLAARNVLVGENYVMKVADFGLARDIYKDEHYVKTTAGLLPVKWMAIEALVDRIYTHQSDVWSFGVLLWEIFTLGGSPYPGLPANEVYQYLMEGQRMEQPHDCPDEIYALMLGCWEHESSSRPPFSALVQAIDKLLEERTTQAGEEYLELENEQDVNESQPYYLEPEEMHPLSSPVFDSPQGSPLPPIPAEEIELECLISTKGEQDYLNKNEFVFSDNPKERARYNGAESDEMDKVRADSMERENHKKSESSGNMSDEDEFISEKEHLMKNYNDEKDVCERNSGVFDADPTPYINTRPYANVNNFIKNYGNDGATPKKGDNFPTRQQSERYV